MPEDDEAQNEDSTPLRDRSDVFSFDLSEFDDATPPSDLDSTEEAITDTVRMEASRTPSDLFATDETDVLDPEEAANDPLVGSTVGAYRILSRVGQGGFGTVYKARDTKLDRYAAIKFLRSPLQKEHRRRFLREAKTLANLSRHPSIVQIYAQDEVDGTHYFVLEFLDCSATDLLAENPGGLPIQDALKIAGDCCQALAYAHAEQVLHRDIKPGNILVDQATDRAKLCDFGLARFREPGEEASESLIAGSPAYMSPEQSIGKDVDHRSDIYSLGVTLYKLLSGELPYKGKTHMEIFQAIQKGKGTRLAHYRPDLPKPILDLVKKATATRPENRYQSAKEFEDATVRILNEITQSETPQPSSHHKFPTTAKIALGVATGALLLFLFLKGFVL